MGFLDLFFRTDINAGVKQCQGDPAGVLLDVRTKEEYAHRHIPGSKNLPLQEISRAEEVFPQKDTPLYVYCYSGARSGKAISHLKQMGYTRVNNIGGLKGYQGTLKEGEDA